MNKPLLLFVGPSGSGKTTIANMFEEKIGLKQLQSYTTRPRRRDEETGHIFVTEEEFHKLENIVAYTTYGGYHYCATEEQLNAANIYVVDTIGVRTLLSKYNNKERPIIVIYFDASVMTRVRRMLNRGNSDSEIISRLIQDDNSDKEILQMIIYNEQLNLERKCQMHCIDADKDIETVFKGVMYYASRGEDDDHCL